MSAYTYIVKSKDGRYYVGMTMFLMRRLLAHKEEKGAKFMKAFGFDGVVYVEELIDAIEAYHRERGLKKLRKKQKIELVEANKERTKEILKRVVGENYEHLCSDSRK